MDGKLDVGKLGQKAQEQRSSDNTQITRSFEWITIAYFVWLVFCLFSNQGVCIAALIIAQRTAQFSWLKPRCYCWINVAVAKLKLWLLFLLCMVERILLLFLSCRTHFSMQFFLRLRLEFYCAFTLTKKGFKAVKNSAAPWARFSMMIRKFQIAFLLRSPENASLIKCYCCEEVYPFSLTDSFSNP